MRGRCFIFAMALSSAALADLVHLRDGSTLSGTVKRTGSGWVITDANGKVITVTDEQVQGVEKVGSTNPEEIADGQLASLRRSVENLSDIRQIIDRYQKFIDKNPKTKAGQTAAAELVVWQERLDKGLVKVGGQWMTTEEQTGILQKQVGQIDQVRALMRESRMREADALITQLLTDDPTNISAIYLQGLSQFKQDKWPAARKSFDAVRTAIPDHAPTLNNLGVIMFHQHQLPGAMALYNLAMLAAPENKLILNNVAEAANAIPKEERDAPAVTKAAKTFTEQDNALQARLNAQGWFRWGSTWVNKEQMAELKKAEAAIQEKLEALGKDYDAIKERIGDIELTISANNRAIDRINADRTGIDQNGRLVVLPPPDSFYRIQRDNEVLDGKRQAALKQLDGFKDRAKAIEQTRPIPKYSGLQQIIGVEGTPLAVPPAGAAPARAVPPDPKAP